MLLTYACTPCRLSTDSLDGFIVSIKRAEAFSTSGEKESSSMMLQCLKCDISQVNQQSSWVMMDPCATLLDACSAQDHLQAPLVRPAPLLCHDSP